MDSPCVSSDNESEESFNLDDVACIHDDDDREPLASEEEAARYNADMEREAEIEEEYRRRYTVCCPISRTPLFPDTSTLRFCISL